MKLFNTRTHGLIDYSLGIILMISPWLFGFAADHISTWIPVVLGAVVILYSMFTNYEYGFTPVISLPSHLIFDGVIGIILAASPWIFNFKEVIFLPHLLTGLLFLVIAVSTVTSPVIARKRKPI